MDITTESAGLAFTDAATYADREQLHRGLALLRKESPVHWVDAPGFRPFWALTRHSDIMDVERDHQRFVNEPRPILGPKVVEEEIARMAAAGAGVRSLVHVDGEEHRSLRAIGAGWFRPRAMRHMEEQIRELARRYVGRMADLGGECDFVEEISLNFPLYVIMHLLGVPESDFPIMLMLTQQVFGNADQDKSRDAASPESIVAAFQEIFGYFAKLTADRRSNPTDDLASAVANARVDGEYLSEQHTLSYYLILATAGHDTTSAALAGGVQALADHPAELQRLKADPALMPTAVDEIIRWVTPVTSFMRTAVEDCTIREVGIREGDGLLLSYPSANRDEDVFAEPFRFDVGRTPNKHLSFGFGVHYCLGAALAKMEIGIFLSELLPRLAGLEVAGEPVLTQTHFVGGLKRLPIRYELSR
ncbi:cytochrome P450 [Actinomadura sp. DC4]|uniref:cytochrome P450 n=1 Tax=Actinomadura sp. DC4 TaxID=3055069 RepID=UPI0025AFC074|nr:cytochrome P450 [Actinomadura sp. DC4]MDN3351554.1 cytochrome P450 [Actinomadura sp. DC4]